ncbi:MAG: hypothetical protein ABEH38_02170 [Flavobacteriales bacterium]
MSQEDPFFKRVWNALFPSRERSDGKTGKTVEVPVHNEELKRSEEYEDQRKHWMVKGDHLPLLRSVLQAYRTKQKGVEPIETDIFFHGTPYGNGFFFTYKENFGERNFSFLFDLFRDRALEIGYRKYHSDRRILEKDQHYETIERHFLKPPINKEMDVKKGTQLYGNLLLEQDLINEKPSYIKVMANIYSDGLYHPPLPFEELVVKLLGNSEGKT